MVERPASEAGVTEGSNPSPGTASLEFVQRVYVSESRTPGAGRGVFAGIPFRAGDVIESCPVVCVTLDDPSTRGTLANYFFHFGDRLAVALGMGSLYNHEYEPNATYVKNHSADTVEFVALRDIARGEEITVNYNGGRAGDFTTPRQGGISPAAC